MLFNNEDDAPRHVVDYNNLIPTAVDSIEALHFELGHNTSHQLHG